MSMRPNLGALERVLRGILGIALLWTFFGGPKTMAGLVGLLPLVTAITAHCPIYASLGLGTRAPRRRHG